MNNPLPEKAVADLAMEPATGVGTRYRALARDFRSGALATPELDARLLICAACGISHETFVMDPGRALDAGEEALLMRYRERRLAGEPVSRVLGEREFWGLRFGLSPDTLDPRPDTETLVAATLELAARHENGGGPLSILDIGTGSGCILVSLLVELADARGTGSDISEGALDVARANAKRHGVVTRARFIRSDWFEEISGRYDFIVGNPPYIAADAIDLLAPEVSLFDPWRALDGGADGLDCYRRIAQGLPELLAPGGWALFEVGAGQDEAVITLMRESAFGGLSTEVRVFRDLGGIERCVAIRAPIERTMTGQKGVGNRR